VYASTIHCNELVPACNTLASVGSAVLSTRVVDDPGQQAQAENEQYLLAPRMAVGPLRACGTTGRLRVRRWSRGDLGAHVAFPSFRTNGCWLTFVRIDR
jgi:hypothetical protein